MAEIENKRYAPVRHAEGFAVLQGVEHIVIIPRQREFAVPGHLFLKGIPRQEDRAGRCIQRALDVAEWNQTQRTATGPRRVSLFSALEFFVDATGGNSGSAVEDQESFRVWAIMTHSGCILACCGNWGTPVDNAGLQNALANPLGVCAPTVNCAAVLNGDLN